MPFAPLAEQPGILEPALLLAEQGHIGRFNAGERTPVGVPGQDFLPHLYHLFQRQPAKRRRVERLVAQA